MQYVARTFISVLCSFSLFVYTGCSTVRMSRTTAKVRAYDLNLKAQRGPVRVQLHGRPFVAAEHFNILADSAMWIDTAGSPVILPLHTLERFTILDRSEGMIWGMGGGLLGGTTVALLTRSNSDLSNIDFAALVYAGALVGMLVGLLIGERTEYIIENR